MNTSEILSHLESIADPGKVQFKQQKYGIMAHNSLGVYQKDINQLVSKIGKNKEIALQLFESGIYEGRILCSKIFPPKEMTEDLMEKWVATFENWEICDSFCMKLFARTKFAIPKALEWSRREAEFEKRAGFVIMAAYCMADKKAPNEVYEQFFPIIKREAHDNRIYVKKAVNWALRSIGKRNVDLHHKAKVVAEEMLQFDSKAAKWIAKDALREFAKENVNILDYPRAIYRKV